MVTRRLVRIGLRKGLAEGSSTWLLVGIAAAAWRALRSPARPEVLATLELPPGGGVEIRNRPVP